MLQEGYYTAQILPGATFGQSKTGTEQMVIPIRITHDSDGQELAVPAERNVYLYCSENAWPNTRDKLQRLGFNGDFENPGFTEVQAQVGCKIETYDGKDREKWDFTKGGATSKPVDRSVAKKFAAKYRTEVGKPAASAPRPALQAPPASSAATATAAPPAGKSFSVKPPARKTEWRYKTLDEAWNAVNDHNDKREKPLTAEELGTHWSNTLNSTVGNKADDEITPAEWSKIVDALNTPDDGIPF
jgi:hypothetical protein